MRNMDFETPLTVMNKTPAARSKRAEGETRVTVIAIRMLGDVRLYAVYKLLLCQLRYPPA